MITEQGVPAVPEVTPITPEIIEAFIDIDAYGLVDKYLGDKGHIAYTATIIGGEKSFTEIAEAMASNKAFQIELTQALRDIGLPEQIIVYRGGKQGRISGKYTNVTLSPDVAKRFGVVKTYQANLDDVVGIGKTNESELLFRTEALREIPKPPAVEVPAVPGVGIIHKTNPIEDVAAIRSGERLFAEQGEGVFLLALGVKTVPKNLVIEKIGDGSEVLYLQSQADEVAPIIKRLKEMAGTPATAEKIIERGRLFGYSEADINAFLAEQGLRPPAEEVPAVPEVEREAKIKYFRQQETKWRETAYKIAKEERGEAPFAEAIRKADEFGRQATELEAIPKLPAVKAEEWKLREAIAATAYGLAYGVKEEDLRKHLTRNPRAKYWFEPEDVDYILERAKLPKIIREAEEYFRRPPGRPPEELMPEGSNPMGKVITKEEAIGLLERLSMTPGEAARSLVAGEAERREIMQTVQQRVKREQNKWAPMDPREGPPLPRIFAGLRWPWKK